MKAHNGLRTAQYWEASIRVYDLAWAVAMEGSTKERALSVHLERELSRASDWSVREGAPRIIRPLQKWIVVEAVAHGTLSIPSIGG